MHTVQLSAGRLYGGGSGDEGRGLWKNLHYTFSTWWQARFLKRSFSIRFEWRSVPSRCFGCSLALRGSHLETLDFLPPVSRVELHDDGWVFSPLSAAFFGFLFGVEALPIRTSGFVTKTS